MEEAREATLEVAEKEDAPPKATRAPAQVGTRGKPRAPFFSLVTGSASAAGRPFPKRFIAQSPDRRAKHLALRGNT